MPSFQMIESKIWLMHGLETLTNGREDRGQGRNFDFYRLLGQIKLKKVVGLAWRNSRKCLTNQNISIK